MKYEVAMGTVDIQECARFMSKFMNKRQKRGADAQQAFFILLSANMTAFVSAMAASGFDEAEVRNVFQQALDAAFRMKENEVRLN